MPKLRDVTPVLDNRGQIYRHIDDERWRYREYEPAKRRYRTGIITNAATFEEAKEKVIELVLKWTKTPAVKKPRDVAKKGKLTIEEEVNEYLRLEELKEVSGEVHDGSANRKKQSFKRMLEFFETKGITYANQIKTTTFDDYILFRRGRKKLTYRSELQHIRAFLVHHLRKKGLISNEMATDQDLLPRVRISDDDLDANPSISQRDYNIINKHIRGEWRDQCRYQNQMYFKRYFHTFVHLLWNSGCRPGEMLRVRMRDITITNPKRWSESEDAYVDDFKGSIYIRKTKTGKAREVLLTSNAAENLMKFRQFQSEYVTVDKNSLLFGKPEHNMERSYSYSHLLENWICIIRKLNADGYLEGNKYSDRPYTLYSLRSSWIENQIIKGLDVYLVAKLAGNSVAVIQKHYDRHDVLSRSELVQHINRGKHSFKPEKQEIDILNL